MNWPWNRPEPTNNDLLERITRLERRQELLEDYTDQKLDMMRSYSARVEKRSRDAARSPRTQSEDPGNGMATPESNPRVARLLARRAARVGARRPSDLGG